MRHLDEDATQQGMQLTVRELVILCVAARNNITEYGGFSATQAILSRLHSDGLVTP